MKQFLSAAALLFYVQFSHAAIAEPVEWDDLIDQEAQVYDDPYRDLRYDQIEDLRTVAMETARVESGELTDEQLAASEEELEQAGARLAEAGIDADWLIGQRWAVADRRKKAATAVNPEIDGETVSLGGFAIPAPPEEDGTRVVYLVPERGMCAHVPPPNPNQMIRARLSGSWFPTMMHEPVRLSGKLVAKATQHVFRIVDGDVPMHASFVMDVEEVETIRDIQAQIDAIDALAAKIAERRRIADGNEGAQQEPDRK